MAGWLWMRLNGEMAHWVCTEQLLLEQSRSITSIESLVEYYRTLQDNRPKLCSSSSSSSGRQYVTRELLLMRPQDFRGIEDGSEEQASATLLLAWIFESPSLYGLCLPRCGQSLTKLPAQHLADMRHPRRHPSLWERRRCTTLSREQDGVTATRLREERTSLGNAHKPIYPVKAT